VAGPEIDRLVLIDVVLACSDGLRIYFGAFAAKKRTGFENRSVNRHVCFTKIAKRKQCTNSPNSPTKYQHKSGVGIHLLFIKGDEGMFRGGSLRLIAEARV
jgi:hypothetical protein